MNVLCSSNEKSIGKEVMLEICHASLLERFKIPEGGHRRIGSDPYPLGSSKVSSAKDGGCKSFEVDIYSLSQCDTLRLCTYMLSHFFHCCIPHPECTG